MKTNISRIGLMALALSTSLTAVGQVPDQRARSTDISRAKSRAATMNSPLIAEKRASKSESFKDLDSTSNSRRSQTEIGLEGKSSEKSKSPSRGLMERDGGVNAGGGSFATVDGQTVLSDRYYKKIGKPQTFEKTFPKELRDYIKGTLSILDAYGINAGKFYEEMIASPNNLYIFLSKQEFAQIKCDHYLPALDRPSSAHVQFGCTKARLTYLSEDDFVASSILELALGVIHERLWTQQPNVDQRFIAAFTTALGQLKAKQDLQLFHGDRQPLTDEEMEIFDDLGMAARQLGFFVPSDLTSNVLRQGGGRTVGKVVVDQNSFVGIGSLLFGWTGTLMEQHGRGAVEIKNSTILASKISNSKIGSSTIIQSVAEHSVVSRSEINRSHLDGNDMPGVYAEEKVLIIQYSQISDSRIKWYSIEGTAEQRVTIQKSDLSTGRRLYRDSVIGAGTRIENTFLEKGTTIGSNVELSNMTYKSITETTPDYLTPIKINSGSIMKNLTYHYILHEKHGFSIEFSARNAFEVDTQGQVLDFGGKDCRSKERKVKIRTANDLLQHCQ